MELNKIHQGDALDLFKGMDAESVHMVLTDPPYGVAFKSNMGEQGFRKDDIANDGFEDWLRLMPKWVKGMERVLVPGGCLAMFCGIGGGATGDRKTVLHHAIREVEDTFGELAKLLIWDRCDMGMGWGYRPVYEAILLAYKGAKPRVWHGTGTETDILRYPRIIPKAGEHPTPKPVPLLADLIELNTDPEDIILDPFCGGGPTLEASELLKRKWIGNDIEPKYVRMSQNRMDLYRVQPQMF